MKDTRRKRRIFLGSKGSQKPKMKSGDNKLNVKLSPPTKPIVDLVTPKDFSQTVKEILTVFQEENLIKGFSFEEGPANLVKVKIVIKDDFIVTLQLLFFEFDKRKGLKKGREDSRNLILLISNRVPLVQFQKILKISLEKRISGVSAEAEMLSILQNLCNEFPKTFTSIRKATQDEDSFSHSDFFITCQVTNKKKVELPIDCKNDERTRRRAEETHGNGYFFFSLQKLRKILEKPNGTVVLRKFLLDKAKNLKKGRAF